MPNEQFVEIGRAMEESERAIKFARCRHDMLNCDNGTYDAWYWAHPPAICQKTVILKMSHT